MDHVVERGHGPVGVADHRQVHRLPLRFGDVAEADGHGTIL
jgi:hypothetical protein